MTKPLIGLVVAILLLMIGYSCSRTVDHYRTCRALGHGKIYCSFAATDNK